jgi:hypothetical protein
VALPTNIKTRLERFARGKYSNFLPKLINYGRKKFYRMGPRWQHKSPDMFGDFYLLKNLKIANNSTTTKGFGNL